MARRRKQGRTHKQRKQPRKPLPPGHPEGRVWGDKSLDWHLIPPSQRKRRRRK